MPREPLNPNQIFRECDAREIFGFAPTQLKIKIKSGVIPAPKLLAPPPSRARGWWGWQINEWAEGVEAQQEAWAKAAQDFYTPTPPPRKKATARRKVKA